MKLVEEPDIIELDRHRALQPEGAMVLCYFVGLEKWPVLLAVKNGRLPIGGERPLPIDLISKAKLLIESTHSSMFYYDGQAGSPAEA